MTTGPVRLEISDGIARVTLNRPDAANAISLDLARSLGAAVGTIARADVRVVVVQGAGGSFSAGGDVGEMAAADDLSGFVLELATTFHGALADLAELDAVIIAAVDGVAAGGGLGLALCADVVLASDRALFLTAYEAIGLSPDSGASYLLPRVIGASRARAMSAVGLRVDAASARDIGLAHAVVPSAELPDAVRAMAAKLAARPQGHMSASRALFRGADPGEFRRHLEAEARAISVAAASPEAARLIREHAVRAQRSAAAARRRAERGVAA
ncbi:MULTISPECIES: enoyl-CoA hydratase/isomerase family protein [Microbacterium]|uniref:enoyl-CoA hydratase/isomerase family protein n=1 Tax=Microbacterium TaxID=33882 RepID=UPI002780AB07|nr:MULTISPECIES: enoyl-CoA hydratase/isomerase family protein [Microbacterium]MDQ1085123.1 2-(1,2-epoxy-1,2-dihydrophenyl)acetyl-CoA isomerase [Microbacterium sp. SORGH_AS_0344]MDQ1169570.1 2-(1,2-epoxy-1,2-dihydrophenyl)acetyl-CoA isomerase [Microbacterium proteolyticum]